nr:MAG TPA: hypothetical protein [Caudoviricetes sp.]
MIVRNIYKQYEITYLWLPAPDLKLANRLVFLFPL